MLYASGFGGGNIGSAGTPDRDMTRPGDLELTIPGYTPVRRLGKGGQAEVWLAYQHELNRLVAIKIPHGNDSGHLEQEIQRLASLSAHPNIVSIIDRGRTADGRPFFTMEYIRGQRFDRYVAERRLGLQEVLRHMVTICRAIEHAHDHGLIHLDLKPNNIMIDEFGIPKILDFGLAKLMGGPIDVNALSYGLGGTVAFMSPEQTLGEFDRVDKRSDIYSLGVILYLILTGSLPYAIGGSPLRNMKLLLYAIRSIPPIEPSQAWRKQLRELQELRARGLAELHIPVGAIPEIPAAQDEPGSTLLTPARLLGTDDPTVRKSDASKDLELPSAQEETTFPSPLESWRCPIDRSIRRVLYRCLAKEPARRFRSAADLADVLEAYTLRWRRRSWMALGAAGIGLVVAIVFLVYASLERSRRDQAFRIAQTAYNSLRDEVVVEPEKEITRIKAVMNDFDRALQIYPACDFAMLGMGYGSARLGLLAGVDDKQEYVDEALRWFQGAHVALGGKPVGKEPLPSGIAPGRSGGGSREALLYAADLIFLTRNLERARTFLDAVQESSLGGARKLTTLRSMYGTKGDALLSPPPNRNLESGAADRAERQARITWLLKDPIAQLSLDAQSDLQLQILDLIFEPLFVVNRDNQYQWNSALVESVTNELENEFIVTLKPGLLWHDDQPLNAQDIEFSWAAKWGKQPYPQAVTVVNAATARIVFENPLAAPLAAMAFRLLPKHVFERHVATNGAYDQRQFERDLAQDPIGCGAFRVESFTPGDEIVLKRWSKYPLWTKSTEPFIETIRLISVPAEERLQKIASGRVDVAELNGDEFRWGCNGKSFKDLTKVVAPRNCYDYVAWNVRRPPLDDLSVRRAIAQAAAVDDVRASLYGDLYHEYYRVLDSDDKGFSAYHYDLDHAQTLLEQAGWVLAPGQNVRTRNGRPLSITVMIDESVPSQRIAVELLRRNLIAAGIELKIESLAENELKLRRDAGNFDGFMGGLISGVNPIDDAGRWVSSGAANRIRYSNPEVDRLFAEVIFERNLADRQQKIREIQRLIYEDQPFLFLWQKPSMWVFNPRLNGVEFGLRGPVLLYPGPRNWWMAR